MMRSLLVAFGALGISLIGCGGAKSVMATGGRAPVAAPATAASPNGAQIAEDPHPRQAGQLTAGVWDDNLNFGWFAAYADRIRQAGNADLLAFGAAEQRAAHDAFDHPSPHQELDIQLVIDTTGSMGDELLYLQNELDAIAAQVHTRFPGVTPRWSLVLYRDRGDDYLVRPFDFTTDVARFRANLAKQSAGGGGDFPEAVVEGFASALAQHWRPSPDVARIVFWVADAPPHPGEGGKFAELVRRARAMDVHVYPIASSGIDDGTEYQMRAAAQLTGGRYLFLTDDSGIGNAHAEPHVPCYAVTRLDRAIVRMIATELSGQRVETMPADVVRRVGSPDESGRCTVDSVNVVAF